VCYVFSPPDNVYRECLANGTWAKKGNYSQCQEILNEEVCGSTYTLYIMITFTNEHNFKFEV